MQKEKIKLMTSEEYRKFSDIYEQHLMWCLDNNSTYTIEEWNRIKGFDLSKRLEAVDIDVVFNPSPIMTDSDHEAGKISEADIEKEADRLFPVDIADDEYLAFIEGAKWHASQLSPDADRYKKLEEAFYRLKSLYIAEVRSNPNHVINEASFNEDWDNKARLTINKAE